MLHNYKQKVAALCFHDLIQTLNSICLGVIETFQFFQPPSYDVCIKLCNHSKHVIFYTMDVEKKYIMKCSVVCQNDFCHAWYQFLAGPLSVMFVTGI